MNNQNNFSEEYQFQSKLLIVDDDRQQREMLHDCMGEYVKTIITACNGIEALAKAKTEQPDLILLDIMMPEMNGFDVCTQLKEDIRTKDIPVIFITALNDLDSILKGFSCGGVDYVSKPFHTKEIISRMQIHLKLQFQHRKLMELAIELKATKEETEAARMVAEKANQSKTNFLCNLSHELMTPMNMIQSMTYFALESGLNEKQTEYLQKIKTSSDILKELMDDLLEYSTIEKGDAVVHHETFQMKTVISHINRILSQTITDKAHLQWMISEDPMIPKYLLGDVTRLQRILVQLVDNAFKFTHSGSVELNIRFLEKKGKQVSLAFSVKDTGIGMSNAQQELCFQPFSQGDTSKTRKYGGIGLGLTLCRQLIKIMNGKLSVNSIPDKGSVVTVHLDFFVPDSVNEIHQDTSETLLPENDLAVDQKDTKFPDNKAVHADNRQYQLLDLITQLDTCLTKRNPKKCSQIFEKIQTLEFEYSLKGQVEKIQDNVRRYQFKNAQKQLSQLINILNNGKDSSCASSQSVL
ncbi:MAG: response regulator [Candidatus Magnetomorum sp.]|nr:response regulator [Candidatus Magnetomorum sp.]